LKYGILEKKKDLKVHIGFLNNLTGDNNEAGDIDTKTNLENLVQRYENEKRNCFGTSKENKQIIITGHSLGGG